MRRGLLAKIERAIGIRLGWWGRFWLVKGIGPLTVDMRAETDDPLITRILDSDRAWVWLIIEVERRSKK